MLLLPLTIAFQSVTLGDSFSTESRDAQHRAEELSKSRRRRDFIAASIVAGSATLAPPFAIGANADEPYQRITSVENAADYIHRFCNADYLSGVIESRYNFLYRGLSQAQSDAVVYNIGLAAIVVKDEPYDLLDPETYQSDEAASHFQSLEDYMTSLGLTIKPSNSHLGTTCPKEAAQWGMAASIWPLGEGGVEFAWLENGGTFWPIEDIKQRKKRRINTSQSKNSRKQRDLAEALQGDAWEIMFRADNGFLAVPAEWDNTLRSDLTKKQR